MEKTSYAYELKNISYSYKDNSGSEDDFKLFIEEMKIPYQAVTSVLGMSGHGKTTLLSLLGLLRKAKDGEMDVYIRSLDKLLSYKEIWQNEDTVNDIRKKHLGFALQRGELASFLSVAENVSMPLELSRVRPDKITEKVTNILGDFFSKTEGNIGKQMPHGISGGQFQRVALVRALANDPDILLADEPTGTLDVGNSKSVMEHLVAVAHKKGKCVVLVTHNTSLAHRYSDNIYLIGSGKVMAQYLGRNNFPGVVELEDEIDKQFRMDIAE